MVKVLVMPLMWRIPGMGCFTVAGQGRLVARKPLLAGECGRRWRWTCSADARHLNGQQRGTIALLEENLYTRRASPTVKICKILLLSPLKSSSSLLAASPASACGAASDPPPGHKPGPVPVHAASSRAGSESCFIPRPAQPVPNRAVTPPFAQAQLLDRRQPPEPERALPEKL